MSKICVSIGTPNYESCRELLRKHPFAEIRLDRMRIGLPQVRELFATRNTLIATCRPGRLTDGRRLLLLREAIEAGARYVDIEIESPPSLRRPLFASARAEGCRLIVSYHDFHGTPDRAFLKGIIRKCFAAGADIAKIACRVRRAADVWTILSLYEGKRAENRQLLALGMGVLGAPTRVVAPFLGAPFTYAAPDSDSPTAPGQLEATRLARILSLLGGKRR